MQLRMLARRTTGAMTILGDIAQAAGPIAYHRWDDLMPHLADGREAEVEELRLAYRVPRQVMELALPLLPLIAPDVAPPIAYRDGDEPPRFVAVEAGELDAAVVREAAAEAEREGRTAVIGPAALLPEVPARSESGFDELTAPPFQALTARAAKGLEFDRVVLVEPQRSSRRASESTACAPLRRARRARRRRWSSCTRALSPSSCPERTRQAKAVRPRRATRTPSSATRVTSLPSTSHERVSSNCSA